MRRKEKEITDLSVIEAIIQKADVCRLAMSREDMPYVVPLCFGYQDNTLYFHSAREGKKLDILRQNNRVCFEIDMDAMILENQMACKWGMKFISVIGFGEAFILDDRDQKIKALNIIMRHYSERSFEYTEKQIGDVIIIKVMIQNMTGKQSG